MELIEPLDSINNRLIDYFGVDTITGQPIWRIVFSEDQFEHRLGTYDDYSGDIYLRTVTEVRYVPKYRQWIHEKYVLEKLVLIPDVNLPELPGQRMSYEPIFAFQTDDGRYLPPKWEVAEFIIDTMNAAMGKGSLAKYVRDPDAGLSVIDQVEKYNAQIKKTEEELFGNETQVGDALAHKQAIVVPRNFKES